MKYCPYCGADLADGAASFCMECGKEPADCGRWSEKAKRETRKVTKAYGKETQAPVSKATEKHEKPVGEHVGGAFHPNLGFLRELFTAVFCLGVHECRAKKQQRLCNSIPAAEGLYRIC